MTDNKNNKTEHYRRTGLRFVFFTTPVFVFFFLYISIARSFNLTDFSNLALGLGIFHMATVEILSYRYIKGLVEVNRHQVRSLLWLLIFNNLPFFCFWIYQLGELRSIMYIAGITSTMALFSIASFRQSLLYNALMSLLMLLGAYMALLAGKIDTIGSDIAHVAILFSVSTWLSFLADVFTKQRHKLGEVVRDLNDSKTDLADESAAKSEFLAKMSHEIRTPMNGVLGMLQLLMVDETQTQRLHYLQTAHNSGRALLSVMDDILDFSKIEAKRLQLERIPFDIHQLLQECITVFTPNANEKNLQLDMTIEPGSPRWVYGDPTRIRQIFINLLSNAVKFTDKGGVILTAAALSNDSEQVNWKISVIDTGIGITADQQKTLFESFKQADSSTTRRFGGTGLGLSICKELAELMGGSVKLQGQRLVGSCFTVMLPLEKVADDQLPELSYANGKTQAYFQQGLTALVVDDNAVNRMVIHAMLNKLSVENLVFSSGKEFLQFVRSGDSEFDFVLMDCEMPDLNGYQTTELYRQWERAEEREERPVIALTAHVESSYLDRCLESGMSDYLLKPLDLDQLMVKLQQHRTENIV